MKNQKEYTLADAIRDGIIPIPSYASNPRACIVPGDPSEKQMNDVFDNSATVSIKSKPNGNNKSIHTRYRKSPPIVVSDTTLSPETSDKEPVIFDIVDNRCNT